MKAWITPPFLDEGIEEIEIIGEPRDANLQFRRRGYGGREQSCYWYIEGVSWHRTKKAAIKAAEINRAARIAKAAKEIAHVSALPPLCPQEGETPQPGAQK